MSFCHKPAKRRNLYELLSQTDEEAKKMVHPAGFDEERSDEVREQRRPQVEQRRATRNKVSNPIFCIAKNIE